MKKHIVVLSVMLGFLLFTLPPLAAQEEPAPQPGPRMGPGFEVQKWLDLTPEQEAKLKEMRKSHMEANEKFREQHQEMREEFRKLLQDPNADQKKMESLIDEMHKLRASQMKAGLKFRKDVEKVFTPAQLDKLKETKARFQRMQRGRRFMRHQFFRDRGYHRPWGRDFQRQGMRPWMHWDW